MKKLLSLITTFILSITIAASGVCAYDEGAVFDSDDLSGVLFVEMLFASDLPFSEQFTPQPGIDYDFYIESSVSVSGGFKNENGDIYYEFVTDGDSDNGYSFESNLQFPDDALYTLYIDKPVSFFDEDMLFIMLTESVQSDFTDIEVYDEKTVTAADLPMSIEFTPDETADYAVVSESPVTLRGNITDEDGNELISFESNSLIDLYESLCAYAELEEGKTYYFNIDKYPYDLDDEFSIYILKLKGYIYDTENVSYYEDGEEYFADAVLIDSYHGSDKELNVEAIEGEVMAIGQYAFENKKIKTVLLNEGFECIYNFAFLNCKDLYEIILPDSLSIITYGAFLGCDSLKEISIGKDIYLIEPYALGYDESYQKVDNFVIKGYEGTAAQKYALENGFEFISLSDDTDITTEPDEVLITDETSDNITDQTDPTSSLLTETEQGDIPTGAGNEYNSEHNGAQQSTYDKAKNVSQNATQSEVKQTVSADNNNMPASNALTGSKSYVVVIFIIVLAVFAAVVVIQIIRIKKQK